MILKRRFPNYFTGFKETEHPIKNLKDIYNIEWVKDGLALNEDSKLAYSNTGKENVYSLMLLSNYVEKYGGYKVWFVIGYLIDIDIVSLGLENWLLLKGDHLEGCPQKDWQHNECLCGFRK